MNWEQRLREMILAGGALAVAACGDNAASISEAGTGSEAGAGSDAGSGTDSSDGSAFVPGFFCCNANSDPCCPFLYCDAGMTAACSEEMACQADGGTWSLNSQSCSPGDAGPSDAPVDVVHGDAPSDGTTTDAPSDATGFDAPFFCCNANPDPCCVYLHCGGSLTATCSQELACQADGGTWNLGTGCSTSQDGGQTD
jgi:hypothetical protein